MQNFPGPRHFLPFPVHLGVPKTPSWQMERVSPQVVQYPHGIIKEYGPDLEFAEEVHVHVYGNVDVP